MSSDLVSICFCLQQWYQVYPSPHLLACELTVHSCQPLSTYKKACQKANCQLYQSCKATIDRAAVLVFSDTDTIFVESVGHYRTHRNEVVYRSESAGRDVALSFNVSLRIILAIYDKQTLYWIGA